MTAHAAEAMRHVSMRALVCPLVWFVTGDWLARLGRWEVETGV